MPCGTNTVLYVPKSSISANRKVTYARMVSIIRPHKNEFNCVHVTVGSSILDYPDATTTNCARITTTKCLLNITISTPDARFMTLDIKDFYYGTPRARYEYMKLALDFFLDEIIEQYDLRSLVCPNDWIYMEIRKGVPGLKQAGRIANERLKIHLVQFGYAPVSHTLALWKYAKCDITFSFVVDDFGVKYVGKENADNLIQALKKQYTISVDWTGSLFCDLHIQWDYSARTCNIYMPDYLKESQHKFQYPKPPCLKNAPHAWKAPTYGAKIQYANDANHFPLLPLNSIHLVQQIVGTLLYYAIAVDPTMLVARGILSSQQSKATE